MCGGFDMAKEWDSEVNVTCGCFVLRGRQFYSNWKFLRTKLQDSKRVTLNKSHDQRGCACA